MDQDWRRRADAVLEGFAAQIGLPQARLDEDGQAHLAFDGVHVSLGLDEAAGALVLVSPLGRPAASAYAAALEANARLMARAGGTVAREPGGGLVLLRRLPLEALELPGFEAALTAHIAEAEALQGLGDDETGVAPPPVAVPQFGAAVIRG